MALALNKHAVATNNSVNSLAVTLDADLNDIIVLCIATNGGPLNGSVGSIVSSGTASGKTTAFAERTPRGGASNNVIELWWAVATGSFTGGTITVTVPTALQPNYVDIHAFTVSGGNTASPFDATGNNNQTGSADPSATITTANSFTFASWRAGSGTTTATAPYALVDAGAGFNFHLTEYNVPVSGTQSPTYSASGTGNGAIMDTIVAAADSITLMGAICL